MKTKSIPNLKFKDLGNDAFSVPTPLHIYILKKVCRKYAEGMQSKSLTLPYS